MTVGFADKDREIERLKARVQPVAEQYEYRVSRIQEGGYLPQRALPERGSPIRQAIPANAAGVKSACKFVVYEDAVFIEASYRGRMAWVSAYYLSPQQRTGAAAGLASAAESAFPALRYWALRRPSRRAHFSCVPALSDPHECRP
jgi:hypothetical protein